MGANYLPKAPQLESGRARMKWSPQDEGGLAQAFPNRDFIFLASAKAGNGVLGKPFPWKSGQASLPALLRERRLSDRHLFWSRLALQHGDGHVVDYLSQPVIDYILKSQLYINASG